MSLDPIQAMQQAVDIVNTSQHPKNKVAATLFGYDRNKKPYSLSTTNYWPPVIVEKLGQEARIGNSSGTIHAETKSILEAPCTKDASLCITDPCCPNCAKNISACGISNVYIDHKGFDKDFASRRHEAFESMSQPILEHAGVNIYEINRKEEKITLISENKASATETETETEKADTVELLQIDTANQSNFLKLCKSTHKKHYGRKFAAALAKDTDGHIYYIITRATPAPGFEKTPSPHTKYSFMMGPINLLLMNAAKQGLTLMDGYVYASQVPIERELVNMLGANLASLFIANKTESRTESAIEAMTLLNTNGIMQFMNPL